jgi:hypothetical protein
MARPTKYTPEVAFRILDVIASGCGRELAARMAGISLRTFVNWMARGRAGDQAFATLTTQVEAAEKKLHTARLAKTWLREAERRRVHYQAVYKPQRIVVARAAGRGGVLGGAAAMVTSARARRGGRPAGGADDGSRFRRGSGAIRVGRCQATPAGASPHVTR